MCVNTRFARVCSQMSNNREGLPVEELVNVEFELVQDRRDAGHENNASRRRGSRMRSGSNASSQGSPSSAASEESPKRNGRRSSNGPLASDESPKHHRKSSNGPRLNTWDVPEFLPGAMPRATAVQRALFEARSVKVFRSETEQTAIDDESYRKRLESEFVEKLQGDISKLCEMFPQLGFEIIQESYLTLNHDLQGTIQQLLLLSPPSSSTARTPPRSNDEKEFPVLTDSNGWQVTAPEIELVIHQVGSTPYLDKVVTKPTNSNSPEQ